MALELTFGPMGTTYECLIHHYKNNLNEKKIIIDYSCNESQYMNNSVIQENNTLLCSQLFNLLEKEKYMIYSNDLLDYYYNMFIEATDIYIRQCHNFPDLKRFVLHMLSYNKNLHVYGLDCDFKQDKIGQTYDLIPYCTSIKKSKGKCEECENESILYYPTQTSYRNVCLKCFIVNKT